ncbi:hypothetical protein GG804_25210 [Sphingomonas histidinilytica]|uniref:hypothetical protein n=1 Tax=Rhizorhabdus histidinilytica TaxID=439228 RepID=UPI001ADC3F0F|nr:hypothetical protein [Rhizorhabdus histidinilytica]MBO9380072.1 hypothetical protein [Rhizorhabdus histidinilytica]
MDTILTAKERSAINRAFDIILAHLPVGANFALYAQNYHGTPGADATFFTAKNTQHSYLRGETVADKIERGLQFDAAEAADEEGYRARRIEALKAELAQLAA